MIQEYLFIDNENRAEIEKYRPEKVTVEIYEIENTACWIATYSVPGEKEESANLLSKVNKHISDKYHPTVLTNGCATYYNKMLFPYVNEFERKLRKLLYLKSALNQGDKATANIKNLESKDLGEIFTLLFTDEQFVKNVKTTVNDRTWQFTRQEILSAIEKLSENTTWDHLIGATSVPALREKYTAVKGYRNDVMHAHDIEAKTFRDSKKLFEQVNAQLDSEIGKIIDTAEKNPQETKISDYNSDLSTVLERYANDTFPFSTPISSGLPVSSIFPTPNANLNIPSIIQQQNKLQEALAGYNAFKIDAPVLSELQGLLSEIKTVTAGLQGLKMDIPTLVQYQGIASKIDIPAMTEALKFQNEFKSMVGNNFEDFQRTSKLFAEVSSKLPEIQKSVEVQRVNSPGAKSTLKDD